MKDNNIVAPLERLRIASQQLTGMRAPGYYPDRSEIQKSASAALNLTDELIRQSGCIVAGTEIPEHIMD